MLWSVIQKIPWANPVTLYREPTTNFPPNSTWEYALLTRATCYHTTWWHCRHHGCRTLLAIASALLIDDCCGLCHLSNVPVKFGDFENTTPQTARALHNDKFPCYAQQVLQFSWAVYSFHGGHFASTVQSRNLSFQVRLACDPSESGRSLFQEFTPCRLIFNRATDLLNHIRASGDTSVIRG